MGLCINGIKIGMPYINGAKHNAFINGQRIWTSAPSAPPDGAEYFRFTVQDNGSFGIPCSGVHGSTSSYQTYNWIIDWGDGALQAASGIGSAAATIPHTYTDSLATHQITIYQVEQSANGWLAAFGCSTSQTASNLAKIKTVNSQITATMKTMGSFAFYQMFRGCTGLTSVPVNILPATALSAYCYKNMFVSCNNLTTLITLPATILETECYSGMFMGCNKFTTTMDFPATDLALYCCLSMFSGCNGLTTIKPLPATKLAEGCYQTMFEGCHNLATLPNGVLPAGAGKLTKDSNYVGMFMHCWGLTHIGNINANWFSSRAAKSQTSMFFDCEDIAAPITYASIPEAWK
jgi:hypothetical protein